MTIPLWVWIATVVGILGLFFFDFYSHVRKPHVPTFTESLRWTGFYVSLSVLFGIGFSLVAGGTLGGEFFAGYITEYSLSVDNLFVFLIILTKFAVPRIYQQKVLLIGIAIALVLRGAFIAVGATAISHFSWVFYIFGAILIVTAVRLMREGHEPDDGEIPENKFIRLVRRVVPSTSEYHDDKMTVKIDGKRHITPMLIVMLAIGSTDILFALDSIPAIFGLTREPYIVFTANAFALLGLRQLYFLIGGLVERLVYLSKGLAFILVFIGVKLVFDAMHTNELGFINGGEPIGWAPEIPIWMSLSIILGTLLVTTVASLIKTRGMGGELGKPRPQHPVEKGSALQDAPDEKN